MNRNSILILALSLFAVCSEAYTQSWCPLGATWMYGSNNPWTSSQSLFTYVGDTIVDGYSSQRIVQNERVIPPDWLGDTIYEYTGPDVVTRTAQDMVYWWLPNTQEWDTLYWFGAQLGDKWQPGWSQQDPGNDLCGPGTYLLVTDTGTTIVSGVPLATLEVVYFLDGVQMGTPSISLMERVGNTDGYFFPVSPCTVDEVGSTFSCYNDAEIHYPPSSQPCVITLAVEEENPLKTGSWTLTPMPFFNQLQIRASVPQQGSRLSILDMSGREMLHATFNGLQLELDVSSVPVGIYVLRMMDVLGATAYRKVVKAGG